MLAVLVLLAAEVPAAGPPPGPEERALGYLAAEVPRWPAENGCFSCHHNGDAARALYWAKRAGRIVPAEALAETTRWLEKPESWSSPGSAGPLEEPFKDRKLATLQFASALLEARRAGLVREAPLRRAAVLVAALQDADGSWKAEGALGSPATYGTALATALGARLLRQVDAGSYTKELARAEKWLRSAPVRTTPDAAGILLALGKESDPSAVEQKKLCLDLIRRGESRGGGWGPYVRSPPEVFDTAVVLLALGGQSPPLSEVRGWLTRGRAYLLSTQEEDGSWPETTRPSGGGSYPQRLSTAGWATLALLATRKEGDKWTRKP